jgi:uncharacterized membrane protein YozB (DUF420 family)
LARIVGFYLAGVRGPGTLTPVSLDGRPRGWATPGRRQLDSLLTNPAATAFTRRILTLMWPGVEHLTGPNVILTLRVAVAAVTVLLAASLFAVARGRTRLHGRINMVFFVLTLTALLGLEVIVRIVAPHVFDEYFATPGRREALVLHLCFALPAAILLPFMLYTGLSHRRRWHLTIAVPFGVLWLGTFITGTFFL